MVKDIARHSVRSNIANKIERQYVENLYFATKRKPLYIIMSFQPVHFQCPSDVLIPNRSLLVSHRDNLSILVSATSICLYCLFVIVPVFSTSSPVSRIISFVTGVYTFYLTTMEISVYTFLCHPCILMYLHLSFTQLFVHSFTE